MLDFCEFLRNNTYPGRGIAVGRAADGTPVVYYFIMGRSVNSRNRIFCAEVDGIRTQAFDEDKVVDPSLIIYHPVRAIPQGLIVTNGNQTDTIRDAYEEGGDFRSACMTRRFEPDGPNFTPRISAMVYTGGGFEFSILKHGWGSPDQDGELTHVCNRQFFCYEDIAPGTMRFLSTYQGDGSPLPTFAGEPLEVSCPSPDEVWAALIADNKVSLYANVGGDVKLFNKHLGQ